MRDVALEELGFTVFYLVARKSMESPSWPVSLMALDEPSAASLEAELPRLGNHDYPTLLRKPNVKLCCSN